MARWLSSARRPAAFWAATALCSAAQAQQQQQWQPIPIVKAETRAAGIAPGGEGGQWPRDLVISRSDPNFLLLAIDVGGLYRTLDGGATWEPCNIGWNARGANALAIDPGNADRVVGVAGNSLDWSAAWGKTPHGLYLSTNKGASWKQVLPRLEGTGGALAWDASAKNTAYFLARDPGLFKTSDGGATWTQIEGSFGDARIKVHEKTGAVFIGGASKTTTGLFKSDNNGKFVKLSDDPVHGLDLRGDLVYTSGPTGVRVSADGGKTFQPAGAGAGLVTGGKPVLNVTISPADGGRLACWVQGENWKWVRYFSLNGGQTWKPSQWDNRHATLPFNVRQGYWAYHPSDPNLVYCIGGDWVSKSTDGGATFRWSANGYNGIMVGGMFSFSAHDPATVLLAFQDYNGAFTTNNGQTWNYRDISGKGWGGYCYGGHAVDKTVMWAGDAPSWNGKRTLKVSRDGGKTWAAAVGGSQPCVFAGPDVSFSDPTDPNVCFASNWRSIDKGRTWAAMPGCEAVYTASPTGARALFGKKNNAIVRSADKGATWTIVAEVAGGFDDLAYDHARARFYVASQERLKKIEKSVVTVLATPPDQYGAVRVTTVAVDPADPAIVYAGGPKNIYLSHSTVCRSVDAGQTWTNLSVGLPLSAVVRPGPREVSCIRVHPVTREAWASGQCFGLWKIAAPPATTAAQNPSVPARGY